MARVVLVHGFTQTARSWDVVAAALAADGHEIVTVDLPGHAGTAPAAMPEAAERVADVAGEGCWIGYSMGARLCLHVALVRPSAVARLVLLGGSAGVDDPRERSRRRHNDELLAVRLERDGVAAFLDDWLAQPMFAGLAPGAAGLEDRLRNTADGLAGALRLAGTGAQEPLWDRLPDLGVLAVPVLLLAGELDGKFKALARRMAGAIGPTATVAWVPGAGHAAHLERPDSFVDLVRPFLRDAG